MFASFYYGLRDAGIPVQPTAYLRLHQGLRMGLASGGLTSFYRLCRTVLVKSEKHFDTYDRVFLQHFKGVVSDRLADDLLEALDDYLESWLEDPLVRELLTDTERESMTTEELLALFEERLAEQDKRHDGGGRWIGTGGRSPFGHSGQVPGGIRIGGGSRMGSAVKVAGERRWRNYSSSEVIREQQMGEAVRRLRQMKKIGAERILDIDESIRQTVKLGGEIELAFSRDEHNKIRVLLLLDNGGWSMDPYIMLVSQLFVHVRDQIRELKTHFFHNCIYETLWTDPRRQRGLSTEDVLRLPRDYKLIIVGDASMAPEELEARGGAIYRWGGDAPSGIQWLRRLADRFDQAVWINPIQQERWRRAYGAYTISRVGDVFPMFDLSLDGIERAVDQLNRKSS